MAFIIGTAWDGYFLAIGVGPFLGWLHLLSRFLFFLSTVGPLGVEPFLGWLHLLSGLVFSFPFYSWTVRRWTFLGLAASFTQSLFFFQRWRCPWDFFLSLFFVEQYVFINDGTWDKGIPDVTEMHWC
jgi:hypothetical protein